MHSKTLKRISVVVIAIAVLLLTLKALTAVVLFNDGPTTLLVVKSSPSWSNLLVDAQPHQYWLVLVSDENGFIGLALYQWLVDHAGAILLLLGCPTLLLLSSRLILSAKSG